MIIVNNKEEAIKCINNIMIKKIFGASGKNIIIEEFIEGEEISLFALVDTNGFVLPLTTAQAHKKIGEGDKGLNTGGMGAYSPVPFINEKDMVELTEKRTPRRLPSWLKVKAPGSAKYLELKQLLKEGALNTVCEEAHCPNIGECWTLGTATFMILGDTCTRACAYCAVNTGKPQEPDLFEPARLAQTVERMKLEYAVITSVDRDDLKDGGASFFASCIRLINKRVPDCKVEVLIPDFN